MGPFLVLGPLPASVPVNHFLSEKPPSPQHDEHPACLRRDLLSLQARFDALAKHELESRAAAAEVAEGARQLASDVAAERGQKAKIERQLQLVTSDLDKVTQLRSDHSFSYDFFKDRLKAVEERVSRDVAKAHAEQESLVRRLSVAEQHVAQYCVPGQRHSPVPTVSFLRQFPPIQGGKRERI